MAQEHKKNRILCGSEINSIRISLKWFFALTFTFKPEINLYVDF